MLIENLVTRRVSEETGSKSSLTRRVTKQGQLLLAALARLQIIAFSIASTYFATSLDILSVGDKTS